MISTKKITHCIILSAILITALHLTACAEHAKPNIVVILADDMGIDSVAALNDKSAVPTPHLDKLLTQGMLFTDAHSGSAVCSPTRYGLLTGRYSWRSRLKRGIVGKWQAPLINKERITLPGMLKKSGYNTACIGKWHLGWNWPKKGGGFTTNLKEIDFSKKTEGGPIDRGFDYYFGDDVPNWPPFVWIENDKTIGIPNKQLTFPKHYYSNNGIGIEGWTLEDVLAKITSKCVEYINDNAKKSEPFFLYFPMTSPHTPIAPSKQFQGKSGISAYADLLIETDWCVGQVLKALEDNGVADDTLVFFTADNGTSPKCNFEELIEHNTDLQNHWRGMKADGYEGGHRVPFIVRWPGKIKASTKSDQTISLVDIMATCADAAEVKLPDSAAEDSVSLMPVLRGDTVTEPLHEAVICHSAAGVFVVRKGDWKLQYSAGSGGWSRPKDQEAIKKGLPKWQLYNLSADPKETKNLLKKHPEIVKELTPILRKFIENGRSTPGTKQQNHNGEIWWRGMPWKLDEAGTARPKINPAAKPKTHLFILSGQSNMAGLNPDISFTPTVETTFGNENVIVIKDAASGQPIRRWYKKWKPAKGDEPKATGDLYDRMMKKVNTVIKGKQIDTVTFVWMQGERDAKENHGEVYGASFKGLIKQLSADLKRKDINFVIGRLSDFDMSNKRYPHWTMVRDAQVQVAEESPRGEWVNTDDLNNKKGKEDNLKDDLHYSRDGYKTLGERFAKKAIELIGKN